jgi:hypothetical protein
MKVQVWTKFSKTKLWKKVKSPLSMNFGRISTSKCRSKLQKMGVLYTHSLKSPSPSPKLPKMLFFKIKKFQFFFNYPTGVGVDPQPTGDQRSPAGRGLIPAPFRLFPFFLNFFFSCPPLFVQVVNSCWLAPAHARPNFSLKLQTSISFDP